MSFDLQLLNLMNTNPPPKEEHMSVKTQKFVRKPFEVEAVQVTEENMTEVAKWCRGKVQTVTNEDGTTSTFIAVKVQNATTDRHKQAELGDWVLKAGHSFKVYLKSAFEKSFVPVRADRAGRGKQQAREALQELLVTAEPATEVTLGDEVAARPPASPSPAFLAALAQNKNAQRS